MGQSPTLGTLLFFLGLHRSCAGFLQENCTDYKLQFERVFSVPGDVAMLNTTLVSPDVFDFTSVPYNITWYESRTGREMSDRTGRVLVRGETLWFLNLTLEDAGEYVSVLRTPSRCYMQATKLQVEPPAAGECGRPQKAYDMLTKGIHDRLHCPLDLYINQLDRYNVTSTLQWYKGCDPIQDDTDSYFYISKTTLGIAGVELHHNGSYTCTLTFALGGVSGSVSETIETVVLDEFELAPQVREPAVKVMKAPLGSNFTKRCLVFVPGTGVPFIDVLWLVRGDFIMDFEPSDRVYTSEQRSWIQGGPRSGMWIERMLMFSELKEEDFYLNYTCQVYSSRGLPHSYFTLLPADPNVILPMGLALSGVALLFVCTVALYYTFKIDIVLWVRRAFPVLYANTDSDGRLYDAYVAYPQPHALGFSQEVEAFALRTLPQVLEKACGYKLFIAGRDCLPGEALVNSVEANIQASRRFLLLYTASTFSGKSQTGSTCSSCNNNNNGKEEEVVVDTRQQLECVAAMHRALMERSLKVVLVELEEVSPAQLALFPESVRHLRRKQGAICWWKNSKTKTKTTTTATCLRRRERDVQETQTSASLSPSSRFWKEVRYQMPVRGKRAGLPERTALLSV
ncbi:unnamed protein product [Ophioblennius macclurei]